MKENYLAKWLNNELSEEDLQAFRDTPEYKTYERIASVSQRLEGPAFDADAALARLKESRTPAGGKVVRMRPLGRWIGAAAAVVLMLGAATFYLASRADTVEAGYAQRQEVQLPDASEVFLNAGTELSYRGDRWDQQRSVELQGEAFFKVAKGETFTVETGSGSVTVLGTQFNVLQRGDIFVVSCYEGLVRVDAQGTSVELPAGTSYRLVGGQGQKTEIAPADGPSWMQSESTFNSMPLSFVLEEFQRQYDMEVETRQVNTSQTFTGTFSNTNMNLALESISAPFQLTFEVKGNKVLLYAEKAP